MADWINALGRGDADAATAVLHLFGGPFVTIGSGRLDVPDSGKRLLAFVALHCGAVDRRYAAGTLWPICDDRRAAGNLRSALWRLRSCRIPLVTADKTSMSLSHGIVVDVDVVSEWASRLIQGSASQDDLVVGPRGVDALDLLPGWYDDWVLMERERNRQRLLHALEALTHALIGSGRCAEAVEAAMLAVTSEPLRESAQRALIEAHLAEGNWVEGRRRFETYRRLLMRELGIEPRRALSDLLRRTGHFENAAPPRSNSSPVAPVVATPIAALPARHSSSPAH